MSDSSSSALPINRSHPFQVHGTAFTELLAAYWRYAQTHYVKNGKPTSELAGLKTALRFLRQQYGHTAVSTFGPLGLKALQQQMIDAGQNPSRRFRLSHGR